MDEHPKVVQERLGHATIGVTMDIYSHIMPDMQRATADKLMPVLGPFKREQRSKPMDDPGRGVPFRTIHWFRDKADVAESVGKGHPCRSP